MNRSRTSFETIKKTSNFCIYCGKHLHEWEKVIDHFEPVASWWWDGNHNLFVSCRECNSIKSDKIFATIPEAREFILDIKYEKWIYKVCKKCYLPYSNDEHWVYCSKECFPLKEKVIYNKECEHCSKKITTTNNSKKFCNETCRNDFYASKYEKRNRIYTHSCRVCSTSFTSSVSNAVFCSDECRNRNTLNKCECCGKEFYRYWKVKYCSRECLDNWRTS